MSRRAFLRDAAVVGGAAAFAGVGGCDSIQLPLLAARPLTTEWDRRKPQYDYLIIGSGYGGGIAAARLSAQVGATVAVLERGREWPVGTFPADSNALAGAARIPGINPFGLFELRGGRGMTVLQGSGLGGTSLINGNVALTPDADVFETDDWPAGVTLASLQAYYARARAVLSPQPHPRARSFRKFQAMQLRADELSLPVEPVDLAVHFGADGSNAQGVQQRSCIDCGDCMTGCNVGAKNTIAMNYLPIARDNGADILTGIEIRRIEKRDDGGWRAHGVRYLPTGGFESVSFDAKSIVLAAGSIGSTEILLRSRAEGLALSDQLGARFSGNGDYVSIAYNGDRPIGATGFGNRPFHPRRGQAPGTAVLGAVRYRSEAPGGAKFLVEDLAYPSAMLSTLLPALGLLPGEDTDAGDEAAEIGQRLLDRSSAPYNDENAINRSLAFIVSARDNGSGHIELNAAGDADVIWDTDARREDLFYAIDNELREYARSLGAKHLSNPVWRFSGGESLITAHPLGGCAMADAADAGVVDAWGRVFDGAGDTHAGLYVADGSLIPAALGANPFMTIAALAERVVEGIIARA